MRGLPGLIIFQGKNHSNNREEARETTSFSSSRTVRVRPETSIRSAAPVLLYITTSVYYTSIETSETIVERVLNDELHT
uniref:Uncharacterized protein n=1 Tax=Utricularia reniformis TaxID=192314 RepID=A0A1Y0AZU7_9LAMI|nr:hypothetical protein AEK19_MT0423 [Utricularia reniformis]ART30687.1 hypothetical protein AEK19_MT0423 [Utricularia reniformis]